MPLIDVECSANADHVHEVNRPIADWPKTPPCPTCGAATTQTMRPRAVSWSLDPIVVYRAPDGSYRFPGDTHGAGSGKYDRVGYERIEIRSALDARRVEAQINRYDGSVQSFKAERDARMREAGESARRSDLFHAMKSMSNRGKEVAREAIAQNNARSTRRPPTPGTFIEVLSLNRSNRD